MSIKRKIEEGIIETLKYSTFNGIPNIVRNPFKLVKLMWLICFLCSASYFIRTIFDSLSIYFDYKVETKIEVRYLNEVSFPLVKICRTDFNEATAKGESPTSDKILFLSLSIYTMNLFKSNGEAFHKTVGIANFSDILISCTYNLRYCNASEFGYIYDFGYGSCWQFNSGKDSNGNNITFRKAQGTSFASGLSMELYLGASKDNYNLFSFKNALEISISTETTDSVLKQGIKVSSGYSYHLSLEKYTIKTQPRPYTNCVNNLVTEDSYPSQCYKKTLQQANRQERLYHYADCSYMCFQKLLGEKCMCYNDLSEPYYSDLERKCISIDDVICIQYAYAEFLNNITHMDECDCPRECTEIGYSVTSSFTNYPTKYRAEFLAKNIPIIQNKFLNNYDITHTDLEKRIVSVHIYFNELKEMKISQKPKMLIFDLIAQIGSQMGVFLGASFLSFIEIFEILIQSIVIISKSR